jgi:hypothetical protein
MLTFCGKRWGDFNGRAEIDGRTRSSDRSRLLPIGIEAGDEPVRDLASYVLERQRLRPANTLT